MRIITWISVAVLFFSVVAVIGFFGLKGNQVIQEQRNGGKEGNPGYYEQFLAMKRNAQGIIPRGLYARWKRDEMLNKRNGDTHLAELIEVGPYNVGGRTRALLVDFADADHILAGGISGGLWQSWDRGGTWKVTNDFASNLSVSCITQHPFNPDIIYYGTGEGIGNSAGIPGEGIFKSTDGGKSFLQLASTMNDTFEYIWSIKASLTDSNTIYVATDSKGVFRSNDGGQTFSNIYKATQEVYDLEVFPDGKVMFGLRNSGLLISSTGDSGTFSRPVGTPATTRRVEIAYCDSFPDVIYVQYANSGGDALGGIYRSTDGGANWNLITGPASNLVSYKYAWYCFMLKVKPDNPDVLITGSVNAAFTINGGLSWNKLTDSHADYHSSATFPDDNTALLIGNDGGIYQYDWDNLSTLVQDMNSGYNVTQFYTGAYFPWGYSFIGGTQDNGTWVSKESDPDFIKAYGGDGSFTQVHQQNPGVVYVSWQNGNILRTDDITSPFPHFENIKNELDFQNDGNIDDGEQLYFVTKKRVYRSTNRGDNWIAITKNISTTLPSTQIPYAIGLSKGENPTLYVGGQDMLFYRVDNAKTVVAGNEVDLNSSVPSDIAKSFISNIEVHPSDPTILYVALSNYENKPRIWKVTEATSSSPHWWDISGDLPALLPVNWIEADPLFPDSVLIAATDFGLYVTTDGGTTWIKEDRIPNVSVHQVRLRESDRTLFIFTHGRGVWRAKMEPVWPTAITAKDVMVKSGIFPNPTNGKIEFNISQTWSWGSLSIFDLNGKTVLQTEVRRGSKADISTFEPGIYLYQLQVDNRLYTGKVIKQ